MLLLRRARLVLTEHTSLGMSTWNQDLYLDALNFAARAHHAQTIPGGDVPYLVHLCQVAMEVMASPACDDLALACALLHDTIEDTATTFEEIQAKFGLQVAQGVSALSKDLTLPKNEQMADSLRRLAECGPQVQMVKLADRITNLQEPPHTWPLEKRRAYQREAQEILSTLGASDRLLASRLAGKIQNYSRYLST